MAQSNVSVAFERLEAEQKSLTEALARVREAQMKYKANLDHENEQEVQFRKELNTVTEALKQLEAIR